MDKTVTVRLASHLICNACGGERKPAGIFFTCINPVCVENPNSKAAAIDRRATIDAWERDNDDEDDDTEDEE